MDSVVKAFLLAALLLLSVLSGAQAQFVGTFKAGNIYGNPTGAEAPPIDTPPSSLGIVSGPASSTTGDNVCFADGTGKLINSCSGVSKVTVLTTATTVAASHCSQVLNLQGGTQWTLTVPTTAGFPNGCTIDVVNNETAYPVGKTIAGATLPGLTQYILYPTSWFRVQVVNGTWTYVRPPSRWSNSQGTAINWYANDSTGNDTAGVNDGLSPARPFKSANHALYTALATIDCNGGEHEIQTIVNMAANHNDSLGVHFAPHDFLGCQGGAAAQLVGASLSVLNAANNGSGLCRLSVAATATFQGSISGTTLTVSGVNAGSNANGGSALIVVGAQVTGTGVTGGTTITGLGTGAGGVGTYTVNVSQSVNQTTLFAQATSVAVNYATGQYVMVYGVGGATTCNGMFKITVVNGTTIDLQGSTISSGFTGGGTVSYGSGIGTTDNQSSIATFFAAVLQVWNLGLIETSGVANSVTAQYGSHLYFASGNFFYGTQSDSDFLVDSHARIITLDRYGIGGTLTGQFAHIVVGAQGYFQNQFGVYFLAGLGYTYNVFAEAASGGILSMTGPITLGPGAVVVGKRCDAELLGLVDSETGSPNTYFPGNSNCTTSVGGQVN